MEPYEAVRSESTATGRHDAAQSQEVNLTFAPRVGLPQAENDAPSFSVQSVCGYVGENASASTSTIRSAEAVASSSALWHAERVVAEGQFARVVDEQQRAVEGRLALASLDFRAELLANELRARAKLNRSVRRVAVPRDDDALSNRTASNDNRAELLRRRAADLLSERVDEVNSEQQRIWHDVEKEVTHLVAEMRTFHLDSLVSPINLHVNKHILITAVRSVTVARIAALALINKQH